MSSATFAPSAALTELETSLTSVESALSDILSRPWEETTGSLSHLERANMDILIAFAINDLIWVYLKMKGIDPDRHDVSSELDRIKKYQAKIRAMEEPKEERTRTVDRDAVKRFIAASISTPRRTLPGTSAAGTAQAQARSATSEQEKEQLERVGMPNRFRFIAEKGEKVISQALEVEVDGAVEEEDGRAGVVAADAFLAELDEEMMINEGMIGREAEGSNYLEEQEVGRGAEEFEIL